MYSLIIFFLTSSSVSLVLARAVVDDDKVDLEAEKWYPFSSTVDCSAFYKMGTEIACQFSVTNNHPVDDYYVLKWFTPLEGMNFAYLTIDLEGQALQYDGIMIKRDLAKVSPSEYELLRAGHTITTEIDLSTAYAIEKSGMYRVHLKTQLFYHPKGEDTSAKTDSEQTLESDSDTFIVFDGDVPRKTSGEIHREEVTQVKEPVAQQSGNPLNPSFVSGTAAQQALTKEIHRASYHYMSAAADDIDDNRQHYVSWFGSQDAGRIQKVKAEYRGMKNTMEKDVITYVFNDPRCRPGVYAFTYKNSRKIYLCQVYLDSKDILGVDTKLCTLVHELTHAIRSLDDVRYGRTNCLNLAKSNPSDAIRNGDSYCYFSETTNIFDYGFDSMARWTNGKTYVTRGNVYFRYSDRSASTIDGGYPALIYGNWGTLPDSFISGFDSMTALPNGKNYVTKGSSYVRYSGSASNPAGPFGLNGNWGSLPSAFRAGFDAMTVFPNGKTYVTKGSQYIRYSDSAAVRIDPGYPVQLQGNWGSLSPSFASGFDSMSKLGNEKTYVTKNKEYIRYTGSGSAIDPGYPLKIKGNWGTIKFPGPLA